MKTVTTATVNNTLMSVRRIAVAFKEGFPNQEDYSSALQTHLDVLFSHSSRMSTFQLEMFETVLYLLVGAPHCAESNGLYERLRKSKTKRPFADNVLRYALRVEHGEAFHTAFLVYAERIFATSPESGTTKDAFLSALSILQKSELDDEVFLENGNTMSRRRKQSVPVALESAVLDLLERFDAGVPPIVLAAIAASKMRLALPMLQNAMQTLAYRVGILEMYAFNNHKIDNRNSRKFDFLCDEVLCLTDDLRKMALTLYYMTGNASYRIIAICAFLPPERRSGEDSFAKRQAYYHFLLSLQRSLREANLF